MIHEAGSTTSVLWDNLKGLGGEEVEGAVHDGGTHVPLWLIHVDVRKNNHNIAK